MTFTENGTSKEQPVTSPVNQIKGFAAAQHKDAQF